MKREEFELFRRTYSYVGGELLSAHEHLLHLVEERQSGRPFFFKRALFILNPYFFERRSIFI